MRLGADGREGEGAGDEWKVELQQIHGDCGHHQIGDDFGCVLERALEGIGCNLAAQNRLLSNSVPNINEIVLRFVNQAIARIQDSKDPLVKGEAAMEWTLKNILISCEDVLRTHM